MLVPMRPEELDSHGKPTATLGILLIWWAVHIARATGLLALDWDEWGLVPGDLVPRAVATHLFLQASWQHLIGGSLLLIGIGPALEHRWGKLFFVAFFLVTATAANAIYAALSPGLLRPLVGATGGITALLGAGLVLYWASGLHYTSLVPLGGKLSESFSVPVYALGPVWLVCEVVMASGEHVVGMTRGSAYWAQLAGVAMGAAGAFALRHWKLEERLPGAGVGAVAGPPRAVAKAFDLIKVGEHEQAFEMLEAAARERPDDPDTITNLWETACACGKVERAAPLVLLFVQQQITEGDETLAVSLWCEIVGKAPKLQAHPRALVELAKVLRRDDRKREAAWTLRCAAQQRALLPGAAMRIAELCKGLHPSTGIAAGRRALETPGLDQVKRSHIEELIHTLEQEKARGPEIDLDAGNDRSIAIDFEDPLAPLPAAASQKPARDPNADSGFELSADGSLVEGDTGVDLAIEVDGDLNGELGAPPPPIPNAPSAPGDPTQPLAAPPETARSTAPSPPQPPVPPEPADLAPPAREEPLAPPTGLAPPAPTPNAPIASQAPATAPTLASVAPTLRETPPAAPPQAPATPPPLAAAPTSTPSAGAPATPPPLASPAPTGAAAAAPPSADDVALNTAAQEPSFPELKVVEGSPVALGTDQIDLAQPDGRRGRVPFSQIQAVAVGAVHGLSAKPVILIDLIVNWNSAGDGPLRAVRLRSDRFDARRLAPEAGGPMDAIRAILAALLDGSGALPLPDPEGARGRPVRIFPDLASYERNVLKIAG